MTTTEVIITTYNNPIALNLVLCSLSKQSYKDFSICIADDGSKYETKNIIQNWRQVFNTKGYRHLWHEDLGFRKNIILNQAIASSTADYLIFIDGDCVASPNFISRHIEKRKVNHYCTGGVIRLSQYATELMNIELISSSECFTKNWFNSIQENLSLSKQLKLGIKIFSSKKWREYLEQFSTVKRTWNGGNSSTWRELLIKVNGFDESLQYGGEDIELGVRLQNCGIQGLHIRYTAPLLHLEHTRSYVEASKICYNKKFIKQIIKEKKTWTENGISKNLV